MEFEEDWVEAGVAEFDQAQALAMSELRRCDAFVLITAGRASFVINAMVAPELSPSFARLLREAADRIEVNP